MKSQTYNNNQEVKAAIETPERSWETFPDPQGWAMKWAHSFEFSHNGHNGNGHNENGHNGNGQH